MLEIYIGKLERKEGYLEEIEQNMRTKVKGFLKQELKLAEERVEGPYFSDGGASRTNFYTFYKENGDSVVKIESTYLHGTYTHKVTGSAPSKTMKDLTTKLVQLYEGYEIKRESGGPLKGFKKI